MLPSDTASPVVAGFGLAVVDVIMATETINLEQKNPTSHQAIQTGGVVPTALITLARLGVPVDLHTIAGDDTLGNELLTIFTQEHMPTTHIILTRDIETPFACVVIHKQTGARTIFYSAGKFVSLTGDTFIQPLSSSTQFVLVDGHNPTLTRDYIQKAKTQKARTLLDMGNPKEGIEDLARQADGIIIPQAYWKTLATHDPEAIVKEYLTHGPSLVVLTMGEKGSFIGTKDSVFYQPAYAIKAVDTNGAGDVFFGSFAYGLTKNWPLPKTATFASGAAAHAATIFGKEEKIPRSEAEVWEFIQSHKPITP